MRKAILSSLAAAAAALALLPAAASAALCDIPTQAEPDFASTALDVEGDIAASRTGGYLQIPFDVPAGTTAIRVRYSYDQPGDTCTTPPSPAPSNTLDIGLYSPRDPGEDVWGIDESRGWSGSAVRDLAVAENGFSDEATYEAAPKALVHGRTTRAYRPGAIPAGTWAVELGLAFIVPDPNGIHYRVLVETTTSTDWSNAPYTPAGYLTNTASGTPGWYAGDFHVHGEQEPGNASLTDTLAEAFGPLPGASNLDFAMVVDHNNNVQHDDLAGYQTANPQNLIIPGTEVTTYRGHHNNHGKGPFVDFRGGPVVSPAPGTPLNVNVPDSSLQGTRAAVAPATAFAEAKAGGNITQINHPTIFREAPSFCRGCAWGYDAGETGYSDVEAIEIQTGPAGIPVNSPVAPNPYTGTAIAFYESALSSGAHIAAVGSSDDHRGGSGTGAFDSPVGRATTMVFANELSEQGIKAGVRGDHTYVKVFGNDGPDVNLTATVPGNPTPAIIGDTISGPSAQLTASVTGATASGRAGSYSLLLLKDGVQVERVPFSGDSLTREFDDTGAGRYSIAVVRTRNAIDYYEVYTSPIWLEGGRSAAEPDNSFRVTKVKRNKGKGTAKLTIEVNGSGSLELEGKHLKPRAKTVQAGKDKLTVLPDKQLERKLRRKGRAEVKPKISFTPEGGTELTKKKSVTLRLRPPGR